MKNEAWVVQHIQQMNQSVLTRIIPSAAFNPNVPPAGAVPSPQVVPPIQPAPTASTSDPVSVEEQRIRTTRDGLLEKQSNLIHQLLVLQVQQADLEMKQKSAASDADYERFASNIIEIV